MNTLSRIFIVGVLLVVALGSVTANASAAETQLPPPPPRQPNGSAPNRSSTGQGQTQTQPNTPAQQQPRASGTQTAGNTGSVTMLPATAGCPTNTFMDVSNYTPRSGATAPVLSVTCANGTMTITTNGVPNFDVVGPTPTAQNYRWTISLNPQKAATQTSLPLGPVAVAINGVPMYGPFEAPTDGTADPLLDGLLVTCNGHAIPFHFHARPNCLVNSYSNVLGYAFDGFAIVTPYACVDAACTQTKKVTSSWQVSNASARNVWERYAYVAGSGDLDQCNGMTGPDGVYRYYATDTFPYLIACYSGTSTATNSGGAATGGQPPAQGNSQPPRRP